LPVVVVVVVVGPTSLSVALTTSAQPTVTLMAEAAEAVAGLLLRLIRLAVRLSEMSLGPREVLEH
jgi:hypothetical protein